MILKLLKCRDKQKYFILPIIFRVQILVMGVLKRVQKTKTQKGKRALEEREPKAVENTKTALFVRGTNCSDRVMKCMKGEIIIILYILVTCNTLSADLSSMKKPHAVSYNQKNEIRPFEDVTKLEFFCKKNDSSLFMLGNHNKKRPHNIILGRMFDYHLLDMFELGLESFSSLQDFKNSKVTSGSKSGLLFAGEQFADTSNEEFQRLKSLLIDFFRGPEVDNVRLAGIEHILQFTALEKKVLVRSYKIKLSKSSTKYPRVELEEIGPSLDLVVRRNQMASEDLFKTACKQVCSARNSITEMYIILLLGEERERGEEGEEQVGGRLREQDGTHSYSSSGD